MFELHIVYYTGPGQLVHEEFNLYPRKSTALEHIQRYMAVAMYHDIESVAVTAPDVYVWRSGNQILLAEIR